MRIIGYSQKADAYSPARKCTHINTSGTHRCGSADIIVCVPKKQNNGITQQKVLGGVFYFYTPPSTVVGTYLCNAVASMLVLTGVNTTRDTLTAVSVLLMVTLSIVTSLPIDESVVKKILIGTRRPA